MPADPPRGRQLPGAAARVHRHGLADDEAIGDELADGLARVGVADLVDFVRVQPDLALAAAGHGRRQALLRAEVHPVEALWLVLEAWLGHCVSGGGCGGRVCRRVVSVRGQVGDERWFGRS